jgi:hypothetical protein
MARSAEPRLARVSSCRMVGYLRRVSQHVLIGRASRYGKELPKYFILCRELGSSKAAFGAGMPLTGSRYRATTDRR